MERNGCEITLADRKGILSRSFAQAYFGHVSTANQPLWDDLLSQCDSFLASYQVEHGEQRTEACVELCSIFRNVIQNHELNRFPVSEKQRSEALAWIRGDLPAYFGLDLSGTLAGIEKEENENPTDSEYVFKSFDRSNHYITLLEENRDIIGHGTTGLTSWQGALFLSDWVQNFSYLLEVIAVQKGR